MIGVNLAGAEFGSGDVYGTDYTYPTAAELDYYRSKGIDLIRLPFSWERMQPTLGGALDPAELARMETFLGAAQARGMHVIVDLHNYGRYDGRPIGSPHVPISAFQDFWTKLAAALDGYSAVWGYGLMNEPHDMGGRWIWPAAAQAAVDGIRTVDGVHTILVSGDDWSGAQTWQTANKNLKVDDPAGNVLYEAHVYFDPDGSGIYAGSYDQEGAYPTIGVDRVRPFIDWLHAHGLHGFIGEYGVPDNDPRWLPVIDNLLSTLDRNGISSTYWAAGPWWGDYTLSIEPENGHDAPQMQVLTEHLAGSAPQNDGIDPGVADNNRDLLCQNDNGAVSIWEMNGTSAIANPTLGVNPGPAWHVIGTGDFNDDGFSDIVWQKDSGTVSVWEMNGTHVASNPTLGVNPGPSWHVKDAGDFNDDGFADILWQNDNGAVSIWEMNGTNVLSNPTLGVNPGSAWHAVNAADYTGDAHADIAWQNDNGAISIWEMDGASILSNPTLDVNPGTSWHVIGPHHGSLGDHR
jgi:endoglucanase